MQYREREQYSHIIHAKPDRQWPWEESSADTPPGKMMVALGVLQIYTTFQHCYSHNGAQHKGTNITPH